MDCTTVKTLTSIFFLSTIIPHGISQQPLFSMYIMLVPVNQTIISIQLLVQSVLLILEFHVENGHGKEICNLK